MKFLILASILVLFTIGIVGIQESFATESCNLYPVSAWNSYDDIYTGKVISVTNLDNDDARITFQVEHLLKGNPSLYWHKIIPQKSSSVEADYTINGVKITHYTIGSDSIPVGSAFLYIENYNHNGPSFDSSACGGKGITGFGKLMYGEHTNRIVQSFFDYYEEIHNQTSVPINPIEYFQCSDYSHVLILHPNDKVVCVTESTAEKLIQRGWNKLTYVSEPGPPPISQEQITSQNVKKALTKAYYENVNLGPLKINDVIVGFGIENNELIIDVLYRYSTSSEMDIVKKKIRNIVGDEIKIEYIPYKEPSSFIQNALVYHWNEYLHKNNIEFAPAYPSHGNNDDGIGDGTFLCSPLMAPNGTEFYIISTVIVEPFLITDTFLDIEKPEFCRKTWKTDVILEAPDRVISLWLEMGQGKIPN